MTVWCCFAENKKRRAGDLRSVALALPQRKQQAPKASNSIAADGSGTKVKLSMSGSGVPIAPVTCIRTEVIGAAGEESPMKLKEFGLVAVVGNVPRLVPPENSVKL